MAGVFCSGEDRQPAMPSLAARWILRRDVPPPTLMPVMSSVDRETRQLQLLLVMGVDDSLGGVVRPMVRCIPRLLFLSR